MKKIYLFLLFFSGFTHLVLSQEVQLNEDPKVAQLMKTWVNANRADPGIEGWRVQILSLIHISEPTRPY